MAFTTYIGQVAGRVLSAVDPVIRVGATAAALFLIPTFPSAAETEYTISDVGTRLGVLYTSGKVDDLRFTVNLQGDQPTATYVWATVGSHEHRVRTNEGYWLPWNGDRALLIDNHFPVEDGKIVFKVLDEDLGIDNHGVTIRVGYKVGDTLKFGIFVIVPKGVGE